MALDITLVPHNFGAAHSWKLMQTQVYQAAASDLCLWHTTYSSCCNEPAGNSAATHTTAWFGQVAEKSD